MSEEECDIWYEPGVDGTLHTDEEIKEALEGICDLKASGADGMPTLFYKKY